MLCPICHIGKAKHHQVYGVLPCSNCQSKHKNIGLGSSVEFTSESIKLQRQAYRRDFIPMHNRKGLEKSWLDRYGDKKARQHGFSNYEIKHATYGWEADRYYLDHA